MSSSTQPTTTELTAQGTGHARRVVLIGASNLTKSIGTVLETSTRMWGSPLEMLVALGHGRSYGRTSRLLGMELPGIETCGLWNRLATAPEVPTAALVTDIGNDVLYEEPVEQIASWVRDCLDRLAAINARTVVTLLPLDNLKSLSAARFYFVRKIFFPRGRISFSEVARRARELNEEVRRMALERQFHVVAPPAEWYGFDPIHIRFRQRPTVWRDILGGWRHTEPAIAPASRAVRRTLYFYTRIPERRRVFGIEQRGQHPTTRLNCGTTISLY